MRPDKLARSPNRVRKHDISFLCESYPFQHSFSDAYLFNSNQYLKCYETPNLFRFGLLQRDRLVVQVNFTVEDQQAFNPVTASFGGIECAKDITKELLMQFMEGLQVWARQRGVERITLQFPPEVYHHREWWIQELLMQCGFEKDGQETNQHIPVDDKPWVEMVTRNEKKRLRKCREAGFSFKILSRKFLPEAYRIIKDTRDRKGFPVTMELARLDKMFQVFPSHYLLFGLFDAEKIIAVAVSIRVNRHILYNFYHGDDFEYRNHSPLVMLLEGVYGYCQANAIGILDLGVSSVHGVLNQGLYRFKKNCGAVDSFKNRYFLKL